MQMRHVEKVYSVKTKSTVNIRQAMWRWSLLKTGHSVWLEVASIFISLVFEKDTANGKEACQGYQVQVCLLSYLSKESLVFSNAKRVESLPVDFRLLNCVLR